MVSIPMSQADFDERAAQLKEQEGIALDGPSGRVTKDGVTVEYAYDGKTLTLTVMHKPWEVTMAYCEDKIRRWLVPAGSE